MSAIFPRRAVLRGSVLALFASADLGQRALALRPLLVPAAPMQLTRRLVRDLHDGKAITVERSWKLQFGWKFDQLEVRGTQTSVKVDAPAQLKALANIEEARREEGMFPLVLTNDGLIFSGNSYSGGGTSLGEAIAVANRMVARAQMAPADRAQAASHLRQLQRAGQTLLETIPADLLFPIQQPVHDVRKVNMPDGSFGEFELLYEAVSVPQSGWLDHAKREVITRVGTTERRSSETWRLQEMNG